jgi:hypothetical protein
MTARIRFSCQQYLEQQGQAIRGKCWGRFAVLLEQVGAKHRADLFKQHCDVVGAFATGWLAPPAAVSVAVPCKPARNFM